MMRACHIELFCLIHHCIERFRIPIVRRSRFGPDTLTGKYREYSGGRRHLVRIYVGHRVPDSRIMGFVHAYLDGSARDVKLRIV